MGDLDSDRRLSNTPHVYTQLIFPSIPVHRGYHNIAGQNTVSLAEADHLSNPTPVRGFYSNMFIVPQKDGGQGPVNRYVKSRWKASDGPRVEEPEGEGPSEPPGNSNAPR